MSYSWLKGRCVLMCRNLLVLVIVAGLSCSAQGGYLDNVGYNQLKIELGTALPTGAGIAIGQVESEGTEGNGTTGAYRPDPNHALFTGVNFHYQVSGGNTTPSQHATAVGMNLYGNTSMAPGVSDVYIWGANAWLTTAYNKGLRGRRNQPISHHFTRVLNHSWGGLQKSKSETNWLLRSDWMVNRDGVFMVTGMNNGKNSTRMTLMSGGYNSIAVGLVNGNHSTGTGYSSVRSRPDIVTNASYGLTSYATAVVSSAAAMLLEVADNDARLVNARREPESLRAILMAGATKDGLAWSHSTWRPLDRVYGAGELNVYNSYHILNAGQQQASTTTLVDRVGWDFQADASQTQSSYYYFDVADQTVMTQLSAVLAWNRVVPNKPSSDKWTNANTQANLADLNLSLYRVNDGTMDLANVIDISQSGRDQSGKVIDNVEHIYLNGNQGLTTGRYALKVDVLDPVPGTQYALAWRSKLGIDFEDPDGDGDIDLDDLALVRKHMGTTGTVGDMTSDGKVDLSDLFFIRNHFGKRVGDPITSQSTGLTAIPEPTALIMMSVILVGGLLRPRP